MSKNEEYQQELKEGSMNTKDFFIGVFLGGIVGAATALLLAPKSGRELRQDLNEQTHAIREKTDQLRGTALDKGSEFATAAKEKTSSLTALVSEQSADLLHKMKAKKEAVEEAIEEAVDDVEDALELTEDAIEKKLAETKLSFDETEADYAK